MRKIILSISIIINKEYTFDKYKIYKIKYIIDITVDFICLFGYLIVLEIIKLNFCELNRNLSDNIIIRGVDELLSGGLIKDNDTEYGNENEKEDDIPCSDNNSE